MARKKKEPAKKRVSKTLMVKRVKRGGTSRAPLKKKVVHKRVRIPPLSRGQRNATGSRKRVLKVTRPRTISPKHRLSAPSRVKLREAVLILRKHVHGYESRDGVDLKEMETWDSTKRRRLIRRAAKLRELTNAPHDTVRPTTRKARKNLYRFSGQKIRGAKHYIIHKPADNFTVRIRKGHVEVEGRFPGRVITTNQFFLFPRRPRYPKELVAMARKLQKEMPPGFYTVLTAAHGDTGEPFERDQIINRLNEYLAAYEVDEAGQPTGFSEALLGFRFMATTLRGAITQRRQIDQRRQRQKEYNAKRRKEAMKEERAKVKRKKARRAK